MDLRCQERHYNTVAAIRALGELGQDTDVFKIQTISWLQMRMYWDVTDDKTHDAAHITAELLIDSFFKCGFNLKMFYFVHRDNSSNLYILCI